MNKLLILSVLLAIVILGSIMIIKSENKPTESMSQKNTPSNEEIETSPEVASEISDSEQVANDKETAVIEAGTMADSEEIKVEEKVSTSSSPVPAPATAETAVSLKKMLVAGGCFWCVESDLEKLPGVIEGISGYAGGKIENPTYKNYSAGGHREVVEVEYDENKVSFAEVAIYTIKHMDPTDGDGSFYDRGESYAPALYYSTDEEKKILEDIIIKIDQDGPYEKKLAVKILPIATFWPAEDYHQNYYKGTLSSLKYSYYRKASGRDAFIKANWGENTGPTLP